MSADAPAENSLSRKHMLPPVRPEYALPIGAAAAGVASTIMLFCYWSSRREFKASVKLKGEITAVEIYPARPTNRQIPTIAFLDPSGSRRTEQFPPARFNVKVGQPVTVLLSRDGRLSYYLKRPEHVFWGAALCCLTVAYLLIALGLLRKPVSQFDRPAAIFAIEKIVEV